MKNLNKHKAYFLQRSFQTWSSHTEQWSPWRIKSQEIKNSDFTMSVIKGQNRLHRNTVDYPFLMIFKGWPNKTLSVQVWLMFSIMWSPEVCSSLNYPLIFWSETRSDNTHGTKFSLLILFFYLVPKSWSHRLRHLQMYSKFQPPTPEVQFRRLCLWWPCSKWENQLGLT